MEEEVACRRVKMSQQARKHLIVAGYAKGFQKIKRDVSDIRDIHHLLLLRTHQTRLLLEALEVNISSSP